MQDFQRVVILVAAVAGPVDLSTVVLLDVFLVNAIEIRSLLLGFEMAFQKRS